MRAPRAPRVDSGSLHPPRTPRKTARRRQRSPRPWSFSCGRLRTNFMCVPPVRGLEAMVTVTFVSSVQGYQEGRVGEIVKRLRGDHPEWKVDALPPETSKPLLAKSKLPFHWRIGRSRKLYEISDPLIPRGCTEETARLRATVDQEGMRIPP